MSSRSEGILSLSVVDRAGTDPRDPSPSVATIRASGSAERLDVPRPQHGNLAHDPSILLTSVSVPVRTWYRLPDPTRSTCQRRDRTPLSLQGRLPVDDPGPLVDSRPETPKRLGPQTDRCWFCASRRVEEGPWSSISVEGEYMMQCSRFECLKCLHARCAQPVLVFRSWDHGVRRTITPR